MNVTKLEQFLLLAELQNMSRAAELLYISQSALSQSVDSLEKELGCRLFDREKRRLTLNENGRFLVPYAKAVVEKNDEMLSALENFRSAQSILNIGSSIYALYILLTAKYNLSDSSVHTNFIRCGPEEARQLLKKREIDVSVTAGPVTDERIRSVLLFREKPYILLPEDSPLCGQRYVTLPELQGMRIYRNKDILKDNSIFYVQGNDDRVMIEKLRKSGIVSDYVDYNTMRLLWGTRDHFFFANQLAMIFSPELQTLPRKRYSLLREGPVMCHYISVLRSAAPGARRFMDWLTAPDNPLIAELVRISRWLDLDPGDGGPAFPGP